MRDKTEATPAGFAPWPISSVRRSLILPTLVVQHLVEEEDKRKADEEEKRADAEKAIAAEPADQAPVTSQVRDPSDDPKPGYYRVLPRYSQLNYDAGAGTGATSVVDKDIVEHRKALRERLFKAGPDRPVAHPESWRQLLDALEEAQPNFSHPLRLVRNALAMADAVGKPVRIPPLLLLGPPGLGKTYFSHCLAEALGAPHASISFDQPTAGSQLRGSDKYWGNTESGVLFNMLCLGECANPVVLLDEIDKASTGSYRAENDPLAQLHSVLEPQTAKRLIDISTEIEFDASQVTYIATANSHRSLSAPILSRFEICHIQPPSPAEAVEMAERMASAALARWELVDCLRFERKAYVVLAALTPRMIQRTLEKSIADAMYSGSTVITDEDIWKEIGMSGGPQTLH